MTPLTVVFDRLKQDAGVRFKRDSRRALPAKQRGSD
jgi:hypothetical protein